MSGRGKGGKVKKQVAYLYKIDGGGKVYVGRTVQKYFVSRIASHECDYKNWLEKKKNSKYCSSFEVLKYKDHNFTILEEVAFFGEWKSNNKIRKLVSNKERKWKEDLGAINKNVPGRQKG